MENNVITVRMCTQSLVKLRKDTFYAIELIDLENRKEIICGNKNTL